MKDRSKTKKIKSVKNTTRKTCKAQESNLREFEKDYQMVIKDNMKKDSGKKEYLSKVAKLLEETRRKIFTTQQSGNVWKSPFTKLLAIPYSVSTITPQNDYYSYVNYRWLRDTEATSKSKEKFYAQIDDFRMAQENVYIEVIELVKKYIKELQMII